MRRADMQCVCRSLGHYSSRLTCPLLSQHFLPLPPIKHTGKRPKGPTKLLHQYFFVMYDIVVFLALGLVINCNFMPNLLFVLNSVPNTSILRCFFLYLLTVKGSSLGREEEQEEQLNYIEGLWGTGVVAPRIWDTANWEFRVWAKMRAMDRGLRKKWSFNVSKTFTQKYSNVPNEKEITASVSKQN